MSSFRVRNYPFPLAILILTAAITAAGDWVINPIIFDRVLLLQGEVWRAVTGHLVHLEWNHLLLNQAGLILIWLLFQSVFRLKEWIVGFVFCALGISICYLTLNPEVRYYVGLSGVLKGLFVLGCLLEIRKKQMVGYVLLVLFIALTVWERVKGALPGSAALLTGTIATEAHLYGALSAIPAYFLLSRFK